MRSPWDAKAATVYKAASYFLHHLLELYNINYLPSKSFNTIGLDTANMLKGLYPQELNNPVCAHNKDHDSLC